MPTQNSNFILHVTLYTTQKRLYIRQHKLTIQYYIYINYLDDEN